MSERVNELEAIAEDARKIRDQLMALAGKFRDFRYSLGTASGAAANLTRQLDEFAKVARQLDELMEAQGLTPGGDDGKP